MRPITLEITGLHSFRQKQVINFDRLLADGLFGIFGPTGSGKSTILDAITLALYGNVRRASQGIRGVINEQEKNATVSFTFEIGNGTERQRYTAERHLAQKKKEGVEVRKLKLIHHTPDGNVVLADKKGEMEKAIQKIIGITLQDFQHAVMLPQGEFASFLALTGKPRGEALQRLFGLQQYGEQLEAKMKRLEQELKLEGSETIGALGTLEQYNDQALEACQNDVQAATEGLIVAEATLDDATKKAEAARALISLIEELSKLEQEITKIPEQVEVLQSYYAQHNRAQQAEATRQAIAEAKTARERYNQADNEYRDTIKKLNDHEPTLKKARDRCAQAEETFKKQGERKEVIKELETLESHKDTLKKKLIALREWEVNLAKATEFHQNAIQARKAAETQTREKETKQQEAKLKLQTLEIDAIQKEQMRIIADRLRNRNDAASQLAKQQGQLEIEKKRQAKLQEEEREINKQLEPLRANLEDAKQQLEGWRDREAKLAATVERLHDTHNQLTKTHGVIAAWGLNRLRKQFNEGETTLNNLRHQQAKHQPTITQTETNYHTARRQREEMERRLGLATAASHLHDGQPCPLCGSTEHPAPYHPEDGEQEQANILKQREQECEDALKNAQSIGQHIAQQLAAAEADLNRTQQALADAESTISAELQILKNKLTELSQPIVVVSASELEGAIADVAEQGKAAKHEREAVEKQRKEWEERIGTNEKQWSKRANDLAKTEGEISGIIKACQQLSNDIADQQASLSEAEQKLAECSGGKSVEELQAELDSLATRERQLDAAKELCDAIEEELKSLREKEKALRDAEQTASSNHTAAETAHNQLETEVKSLKESITQRLNELVPNRAAGETVEMIVEVRKTELERIDNEHKDANSAYDSAQTKQQVLKESADIAYNKLCTEEKQRDTANAHCRAVIAKQGFASEEEATAALLTPDQVSLLTQTITEIERQINEVQKREAELREEVAGKKITAEELEVLEQTKRDAETEVKNAIRKQGAAQETLEKCREQNKEWKRLQAENSKTAERISTIQKLGKYLRANSFVNYLANERLDDVCRRATHLLEGPTNRRLEIYSDKKDGFYIVDNRNGGIQREAGSLSGGETFLVSLALALALSDTIQLGHAPLEFFFLDEGFGTLDNELLDTVMDELERLRSPNRAIGLISHVRELRERIPRKLIVTPATIEHGTIVEYER